MSKYDGIEKADAAVAAAGEITQKPKEKKRGGYLKGLCARFLIAGILCGAVFGLKYMPWDFAKPAAEAVKSAFGYDLAGEKDAVYLPDKIEDLIDQGGDEH